MQKPKIAYPCQWPYRVIGANAASISQVIQSTLSMFRFTLSSGNASTGGTYVSLHIEVNVADEQERNQVYSLLKKIPGVKIVF